MHRDHPTIRRTAGPGRGGAFTLVEVLVVIAIMGVLVSLLLPSLANASHLARGAQCTANLHAMVVAAHTYTFTYDGQYPIAYTSGSTQEGGADGGGTFTSAAWDYSVVEDSQTGEKTVQPGILWQGSGNSKVQQCPSFQGAANWAGDPYTGYNYNTSYIGHGAGEWIPEPAYEDDVLNPQECALFGDGEYASGANKFMRSPLRAPGDVRFRSRYAGTQGYRHLGATNVAFCDGHVSSWSQCYDGGYTGQVAKGTGFLSADNRLYDLK